MKKKLSLLLCALALAFGLVACGSNSDDLIAGRTPDEYESEISSMMAYLLMLDDSTIDQAITQFESYEGGEVFVTMFEDYQECYKDAGDFEQFGEFNVEKSGKTITSTLVCDFSKIDLKMTVVYSTLDSSTPTAVNVEPIYTLGETMQKAALNTVMGILIVFCMLVLMSGVIKCFEIIPKLQNKAKDKKEDNNVPTTVVKTEAKNETDDLQLVAVIAAAIAASTGASTDSFVVRSIKKRH